MSDDDDIRTRYLAGDANGWLPAGERAGLDELRTLLASPAVWVQSPASLEDDVVAAVVQAARICGPATGAFKRRRRLTPARAVAGALAVAMGRDRGRARRRRQAPTD